MNRLIQVHECLFSLLIGHRESALLGVGARRKKKVTKVLKFFCIIKEFAEKLCILAGSGDFVGIECKSKLLRLTTKHIANEAYMSEYSGIAGKRILVTGSTSGLGLAMAQALVKEGASVLITGRDQSRIDQALSTVKSFSGTCAGARMDVRNEQSIERALEGMAQTWGGIDVLINNAGIGMRTVNPRFMAEPKPFWEVSPSAFRDVIDTNIMGYFLSAKAAVPYFLNAGRGRIINIGVSEGTKKRKGFIPYGPSRAGTESLSHIMAQDLAEYGITVNLLQPGGATGTGMLPDEFRIKMNAQLLRPDVMAEPVLFLCSDSAEGLHDAQIVARDFQIWKTNWLDRNGRA